jgi:aspartyl-tRNA(Asn)/glutamyl-tRNA(Gln) amidotransferase subunit C
MKIDVIHIAKLANLPLSSEEKTKFEKQLEETIKYVQELNDVDTSGIEPTSQVTGLENVTRDDIAKPSLTQDQALSNSKSSYNGFLKVGAILDNE